MAINAVKVNDFLLKMPEMAVECIAPRFTAFFGMFLSKTGACQNQAITLISLDYGFNTKKGGRWSHLRLFYDSSPVMWEP
jgi:hypothetical protein